MDRMHIAVVSAHGNPFAGSAGGGAGYVASLSRALAAHGHVVTVFARRDDAGSPARTSLGDRLSVELVQAGPLGPVETDELVTHLPTFGHHLADVWAPDRPSVVHAHSWTSGVSAQLGARDLALPVVQSYDALSPPRGPDEPEHDQAGEQRRRLEAAVAHDADQVIVTHQSQFDEILRMRAQRARVEVIPPGVDLDLFSDTGPALPRAGRTRLVTGWSPPGDGGVQTAIEALGQLTEAELLVAGGPAAAELDDEPEVQRLRTVADAAGAADRVHFLGRLRSDEMPALLRSADVAVVVATRPTFGLLALEAMACGTPVVASVTGGRPDTVVPGTTGLLVPANRPDQLAEALRILLADRIQLEGFGFAATDRARARYGWARVAEDVLRSYEAAIHRRGTPDPEAVA